MSHAVKVEVRELTPELLDDYLRFFDKDAFTDFPEWSGCYCGFYDTPGDDWDASAKAGPAHRVARAERIRSGRANGLLAIADGRVVGWCNAQARSNFLNMRRYATVVDDPTEPVGSIMCFLVAPGHRGKGIGRALLNAACDKFLRDRVTRRRGLSYNQSGQAGLGDSLGRRELQGTFEYVSQSRIQGPSPARTFRNCKKAALILTGLWP